MTTQDMSKPVTRAELAAGLAVVREHAYLSRIVIAAMREDHAIVDALGGRLSELDAELAAGWLSEIPVAH